MIFSHVPSVSSTHSVGGPGRLPNGSLCPAGSCPLRDEFHARMLRARLREETKVGPPYPCKNANGSAADWFRCSHHHTVGPSWTLKRVRTPQTAPVDLSVWRIVQGWGDTRAGTNELQRGVDFLPAAPRLVHTQPHKQTDSSENDENDML